LNDEGDIDYYPFGMEMDMQTTQVGTSNDYTYNGKEMNSDFGLNLSDYGARWYDASIGRWHSIDPLAEKYTLFSPYNYVANNPMKFIDPDGKSHILYLVFKKGDKSAKKISKRTQKAINENDINLTVQVLYVGKDGLGEDYKSKLDKTDALTFVGSESFVEEMYGDEISIGVADERVGYINVDGIRKETKHATSHIARGILHEGLGHPLGGGGHPDEGRTRGARYKKYYSPMEEQNVMTSGNNTIWSKDPFKTGGIKFLNDDLRIINKAIPKTRIVKHPLTGGEVELNPVTQDNFTRRLNAPKKTPISGPKLVPTR
jgi:RHS repeat-associated protein